MIRRHLRSAAYVAVMALMLSGGIALTVAAETLTLGSSPQIPAAQGTARLKTTKNGNVQLRLDFKHLAPPGRVVPGANVFVVWVRGLAPGSEAQSLGAIQVDKNLNARLTAATAMPTFDLFITAEQSQTTTAPSFPELLPLHYDGK